MGWWGLWGGEDMGRIKQERVGEGNYLHRTMAVRLWINVVPFTRITRKRTPPPEGICTFRMVTLWRSGDSMMTFSTSPRTPSANTMHVLSTRSWKYQVMSSGGMAGGMELKKRSKSVVLKSEVLTVIVSPAMTERVVGRLKNGRLVPVKWNNIIT